MTAKTRKPRKVGPRRYSYRGYEIVKMYDEWLVLDAELFTRARQGTLKAACAAVDEWSEEGENQ